MACDGEGDILKHESNRGKTLSWGKMAHPQEEMGVVNKITPIG